MIAIIFIFAIIVSSVIWLKTIARYHCTYNCKLCTFYVLFVVFYISIYCAYLNEFLFMIWLLIASTTVHKNRSQLFLTIVLSSCPHTHWTTFFCITLTSLLLRYILFQTFYIQTNNYDRILCYLWCRHCWILWNSWNNRKITHWIFASMYALKKNEKNVCKTITKATCNVYYSPYQQFMDDLDVWSLKMS